MLLVMSHCAVLLVVLLLVPVSCISFSPSWPHHVQGRGLCHVETPPPQDLALALRLVALFWYTLLLAHNLVWAAPGGHWWLSLVVVAGGCWWALVVGTGVYASTLCDNDHQGGDVLRGHG